MTSSYIKLESEISESFGKLLENKTDSNVIIRVGEGHNFKEFHAHSIILRCRSEYFEYKFSNDFVDKENGKYIIIEPKILPQAFEIILKYLYTGHINFDRNPGPILLNIISASNKFMLNRLIVITEDFIIKNHQRYIHSDPVGILQVIYCCEFTVNLQKICVKTICSNPEYLFDSEKFINLSDYLLEIILEQDDLNLKESEIWDILIRWVLAQDTRQLAFNVSNQIIPVKTNLCRFIHLIEFFEISSNDYYHKLAPYEDFLPQKLREDILKFYLSTRYEPTPTMHIPRCLKPRPDSTIISRKHMILFSNWIDGSRKNITHKFNLIYRASRDGNTPRDFHEKCDNKGAALIVIKIIDSEKIVGGYNPIGWDSSGITKPAMNSYIFKFTDRRKLQTANICYSDGNPQSIICNSDIFGFNDLYNYNCTWFGSNPSSYPRLDGIPKGMFQVDDYEVFQITRETTTDNSKRISQNSIKSNRTSRISRTSRTINMNDDPTGIDKENFGNEVVDEKRLNRVSTFVKTLFGKDSK